MNNAPAAQQHHLLRQHHQQELPPPTPIEGENPFNSDEPSGDDDSSVIPLNDLDQDRDHRRAQLNGGGISSSSATSSSSASKSSVFTNQARRAPDMEMGKCPWVRVYDNVTYIVSAIALRDGPRGREVLLMREAKEKFRGKWYMPAGHVEPRETLKEAIKRELREETGLKCAVETLLCVEVRGSGWYRMAFAMETNGGELKQEPDQE